MSTAFDTEVAELDREFGATAEEVLSARLPLEPESETGALLERQLPLWDELTELGWFDLLKPEAEDGLGMSADVLPGIFAAIGRNLAPGPLLTSILSGPWLQAEFGVALPGGSRIALADPGVASWLTGSEIILPADRLSGRAVGVADLPDCDSLIVFAADAEGPVIISLLPDSEGVTVVPQPGIDPCSSFGELFLEGVPASEFVVLARGDRAEAAIRELRGWERVLISAELSGIVDRALEMSVSYAKEREQFSRPIGSFQAVKHMLADVVGNAETLRNLVALTVREWRRESGPPFEEAAAACKAHAARVGRSSLETALQVHGGIGFTSEYGLHLLLKRALTLSARGGDERELSRALGARALGGNGSEARL